MKTLLAVLLTFLLCGCTSYSIEKGVTNGEPFTNVKVRSTRDLEEPRVDYVREGEDAEFHFSAASVDNNTEVLVGAFVGAMGTMMKMMEGVMLKMMQPVPTPE